MKRTQILIFTCLLILSMAASAMAGGPPPKDLLTGYFTEVNEVARSVQFIKNPDDTPRTLFLNEEMNLSDIRLDKKMMITLDTHAGEGVMGSISIMFMEMTLTKIGSLLLIGLIGGLLSGFIGSGGAFVMTPAMMSLGAPGAIAVASNMCHKFPKAMVGAFKRHKYGQVDIKLGLVMAVTAIIGVEIGIKIQKFILNSYGNAGSNLYVSVVFVAVLVIVGFIVARDAYKLSKGSGEATTPKLATALMKLNVWPMMEFKVAKVRISAWVTVPVGLFTGMLAATIAVGGFVGVPGMIYVIGASAMIASATELVVAFIMGCYGSAQWAISGLVDIRMTLLILAGSLFGVQLGALGTTYVKDHIIKIVMASVMLIVAVSRGAMIPGYLVDVGMISAVDPQTIAMLDSVSFWALILALGSAGGLIVVFMIKGMMQAKRDEKRNVLEAAHG